MKGKISVRMELETGITCGIGEVEKAQLWLRTFFEMFERKEISSEPSPCSQEYLECRAGAAAPLLQGSGSVLGLSVN